MLLASHESRLTISKPGCFLKCALGARNFSELGGVKNHHYARAAYSANIHITSDCRQHCHVEILHSIVDWDCSRIPILLEILKIQSRLPVDSLGVQRWFPKAGCDKNETSVSHSSAESDVVSTDAVLRMDGIPALDLRDLVLELYTFCFESTKRMVQLVA